MAKKKSAPKFPEVVYVEVLDGEVFAVWRDPKDAERGCDAGSILVKYTAVCEVTVEITAEVIEV